MNKTTSTLIVLTFVGMVGIYIGAIYAYNQYQKYKAQAGSLSGATSLIGSLFSGSGGQ
jgi:uncharacterized YccA/Bax inhibitor family protein